MYSMYTSVSLIIIFLRHDFFGAGYAVETNLDQDLYETHADFETK